MTTFGLHRNWSPETQRIEEAAQRTSSACSSPPSASHTQTAAAAAAAATAAGAPPRDSCSAAAAAAAAAPEAFLADQPVEPSPKRQRGDSVPLEFSPSEGESAAGGGLAASSAAFAAAHGAAQPPTPEQQQQREDGLETHHHHHQQQQGGHEEKGSFLGAAISVEARASGGVGPSLCVGPRELPCASVEETRGSVGLSLDVFFHSSEDEGIDLDSIFEAGALGSPAGDPGVSSQPAGCVAAGEAAASSALTATAADSDSGAAAASCPPQGAVAAATTREAQQTQQLETEENAAADNARGMPCSREGEKTHGTALDAPATTPATAAAAAVAAAAGSAATAGGEAGKHGLAANEAGSGVEGTAADELSVAAGLSSAAEDSSAVSSGEAISSSSSISEASSTSSSSSSSAAGGPAGLSAQGRSSSSSSGSSSSSIALVAAEESGEDVNEVIDMSSIEVVDSDDGAEVPVVDVETEAVCVEALPGSEHNSSSAGTGGGAPQRGPPASGSIPTAVVLDSDDDDVVELRFRQAVPFSVQEYSQFMLRPPGVYGQPGASGFSGMPPMAAHLRHKLLQQQMGRGRDEDEDDEPCGSPALPRCPICLKRYRQQQQEDASRVERQAEAPEETASAGGAEQGKADLESQTPQQKSQSTDTSVANRHERTTDAPLPPPPVSASPPHAAESDKDHVVALKCGHVFCKGCILVALRTRRQCPVCRVVLRGSRPYQRIFL